MKKRLFFWSILLLTAAGIFFAAVYFAAVMPWDFQQKSTKMTYQDTDRHFIECSFSLYAGCAMNFTTKVSCIVPADADGVPLPSAENILFYVPFNGEDGSTAIDSYPWLKDFVTQYGWSVFSMRMKANSRIIHDRKKYYIYREAGWYPIIFRCRDIIAKRFSIPVKPLFITGQSSGASLLQRLAVAHPEKIAAGAGFGGSIYDHTLPSNDMPPLFLAHSAGDRVERANKSMLQHALQNRLPVWFAVFEPLSASDLHTASPEAWDVITDFLLAASGSSTLEEFNRKAPSLPHFYPPGTGEEYLSEYDY